MYYRFEKKKSLGFKSMVFVTIIVAILALGFNLWLVPSLITSGVKAISNSCDKTYIVEKVLLGNLFCPDK